MSTPPNPVPAGSAGRAGRLGAAVVATAALAVALTGCGDDGPTEVTINEAQDPSQFGITVTGVGESRGAPDTLVLTIGVSVKRDTVAEALDQAAASSDGVLAALRDGGVVDEDLQTRDYTIEQEFSYPPDADPVPNGFRVTNTVEARLRDLEAAGDLIDEAVRAGDDDVRLQGIAFALEEDTELLAQARTDAVEDARAKAERLAELSGRELGPAEFISEGSDAPAPTPYDYADMESAADSDELAIEPGSVEGTVRVTVRYPLVD